MIFDDLNYVKYNGMGVISYHNSGRMSHGQLLYNGCFAEHSNLFKKFTVCSTGIVLVLY